MWKFLQENLNNKSVFIWLLLLSCFGIELNILNHHFFIENQIISSIIIFISSCFIGIIPLFYDSQVKTIAPFQNKKYRWNLFFILLGIALIAWIYLNLIQEIIHSTAIDFKYSDIIPTIQQQVNRFLHGQKVYQRIIFENYSYPSGYLPANWVPFILAAVFKFDFRYIPFILFYCSLLAIVFHFRKNLSNTLSLITILLIPYSIYLFIKHNTLIVGYSVEVVVATYYLLFVLFMNKKNYILIGLIISLCLLSRYTLILYLPLYFFVMWMNNDLRAIKYIGLSSLLFLLLFYIIPFFLADPLVIINGFLSYSDSGIGEWNHFNEYTGLPEHLTKGAGFAYLFYIMKGGTIAQKIKLMQVLLVVILLVFLVSMAYLYHKKKNKLNSSTFLLGSFKIYLTLFFSFIHVPYIYLYTTSILVTAGILFYLSTMEKPVNQSLE